MARSGVARAMKNVMYKAMGKTKYVAEAAVKVGGNVAAKLMPSIGLQQDRAATYTAETANVKKGRTAKSRFLHKIDY